MIVLFEHLCTPTYTILIHIELDSYPPKHVCTRHKSVETIKWVLSITHIIYTYIRVITFFQKSGGNSVWVERGLNSS